MQNSLMAVALTAALAGNAVAAEGPSPLGVPRLNHVFVIMMENHGYGQIIGNPNAPFVNGYAKKANLATNYFGVGHPSLTNYLEVAGGSNFGVQNDHGPAWHSSSCTSTLFTASNESSADPICPIAGTGTDAATPAVDTTNETSGTPGLDNIDGIRSYAAAPTTGKTIADQLAAAGMSWKSYQESLPSVGADNVNYSDGFFTNLTDFGTLPGNDPNLLGPGIGLTSKDVVQLYAVKHNPFVYFRSVQEGTLPNSSLKNTVGFDGKGGLYADLATGRVPAFSFIAPNQCNDQHGRGNAGNDCAYDPGTNGTQAGLNPALVVRGDQTVQKIVRAIKASPAWREGANAIVVTWDENDYSTAPNTNQVVTIVDTSYGAHGVQSGNYYDHFSLLKSLESGFNLPCLNHACDANVAVMTDLFAGSPSKTRWSGSDE